MTKPTSRRDSACAPGEAPLGDGTCKPAGIAVDGCGSGFTSDDSGGCVAVLPPAPCPAGQLAVPGDTTCHDVAPCTGKWGAAPIDATTQFVDASYASGDSDGSQQRPWKTIRDAIAAAASGAIVAVTDGTYAEDPAIKGKPIRLWGACPARVTLSGTGALLWALFIGAGADASELHDVAVTGASGGIVLSGSHDVVFDRVWIHDTPKFGLGVAYAQGPASGKMRDSLLEHTGQGGIVTARADFTIERTAIRDTSGGWGVEIDPGLDATVTITSSLFERNGGMALSIIGAKADVEDTLVHDTVPGGGFAGVGVGVQADFGKSEARADVTLRRVVVESAAEMGIVVDGADATIDVVVVRNTRPAATGLYGDGLHLKRAATASVTDSLFEGNAQDGVALFGSTLTIDGSVVRGTQPNAMGLYGVGLGATLEPDTGAASTLTVRHSVLDQNHTVGVAVFGSSATIEATAVTNTQPNPTDGFGRGISVQPKLGSAATLAVTGSLLADNTESGICVVDATATIAGVTVRGTQPSRDGDFGDGISIIDDFGSASADITDTHVESNARAGLFNAGANVVFGSTTFSCNAFDLEGEMANGSQFHFDAQGGAGCGCPDAKQECQVLSSGLAPPPALDP